MPNFGERPCLNDNYHILEQCVDLTLLTRSAALTRAAGHPGAADSVNNTCRRRSSFAGTGVTEVETLRVDALTPSVGQCKSLLGRRHAPHASAPVPAASRSCAFKAYRPAPFGR